jgi:hypothetical protein
MTGPFLEDLARIAAGHAPPDELVVVEVLGSVWSIEPLLGQRARLCRTSPAGRAAGWIDESWEYPSAESAGVALAALLRAADERAEPDGWTRHPTTGRRRPDGDASREYIHPYER